MDENTTADEIVDEAIKIIYDINSDDQPFTLKDLFVGYKWKRVLLENRRTAGALFRKMVENGQCPHSLILIDEKSSHGKQRYQKN